ncbi:LacI family DNA-binding transcriptional regulator [Flavihumibacter sp. UBA7668]|uniref:LacI family DNA-binding transcriptional regulator n=1 Tax=Flavihumibacter sp. UBA7668 TaxID=1946542 RepID=UPI0025C17FC9|nr:LacI family DNA-binding transcriptional regulator [Flavihumibacter sp. UBA7668]
MNIQTITIKDIAKALNLSYSTVSRALKGSYQISEPVKEKVLAYAKEHNYRPNLLAQSLKNKNSRCIGVVLCTIPNSFLGEVINGIESIASSKGYLVIITQSNESLEKEKMALDHLTMRSIDGLLISVSTETINTDHLKTYHDRGLPIVFFDRVCEGLPTHMVQSDNEGGAYELTRHLIQQGYRRIAHITSPTHLPMTRERLTGYHRALKEAGLDADPDLLKNCAHGGAIVEEIETAINELFSLSKVPDAVLAASDRMTQASFQHLRALGKSIPNQVALAGFSNFSAPDLFSPALTTVVQDAFEMGKRAAGLLIERIEQKHKPFTPERIILPVQLKARASTGSV